MRISDRVGRRNCVSVRIGDSRGIRICIRLGFCDRSGIRLCASGGVGVGISWGRYRRRTGDRIHQSIQPKCDFIVAGVLVQSMRHPIFQRIRTRGHHTRRQ